MIAKSIRKFEAVFFSLTCAYLLFISFLSDENDRCHMDTNNSHHTRVHTVVLQNFCIAELPEQSFSKT